MKIFKNSTVKELGDARASGLLWGVPFLFLSVSALSDSIPKLFGEVEAQPSDEDVRACIKQEKKRVEKRQLDTLVLSFSEAGGEKAIKIGKVELDRSAIEGCAHERAVDNARSGQIPKLFPQGAVFLLGAFSMAVSFRAHRRLKESTPPTSLPTPNGQS